MKNKVRHLLGISGGKDSAALAIYMKKKYPEINMEYYFCDTGKELDETYTLIDELESFLGKKIQRWKAVENSPLDPFDHFLKLKGGYLPATNSRWCTQHLKLEPFEKKIANELVISYVAIRGDENREGYISTKPNIQTIFPFRKNIWSIEILNKVLSNESIPKLLKIYNSILESTLNNQLQSIILEVTSKNFLFSQKLNSLLDISISTFNKAVFIFLKDMNYPLSKLDYFPLLNNEEIIAIDDVYRLFKDNGVHFPQYYNEVDYQVNGLTGQYNRSRSGCYFCFYQQKIEWIWLYEQHPDKFKKAMDYEKDGFTWNEFERLEELIQPERIIQIKADHLNKKLNKLKNKTNKLVDILDNTEGISCVNCFI
jgi:hypothetical protein